MLKKKIAVVAQWPKGINAENECIKRIQSSAMSLGIEVLIIDKNGYYLDTNNEILPNDVDFIINIHFETPKTYDSFSFVALWNPLEFYLGWGYDFCSQHLATHDDFISCSSIDADEHLLRLIKDDKSRLPPIFTMYHSLSNPIIEPKINNFKKVFYCGINWEALSKKEGRHNAIFRYLDKTNIIKIYGPEYINGIKVWKGFKSYERFLPFDGVTIVKEISNCGISLVLSSAAHKRSELMSNRLFESLAAGAIIIADDHPFIKKHLEGNALFLDMSKDDSHIAQQIIDYTSWVNSHPEEALNIAKKSQEIFLKKFRLDTSIQNLYSKLSMRKEQLHSLYLAKKDIHIINIIYFFLNNNDLKILQQELEYFEFQIYKNFQLFIIVDIKFYEENYDELHTIISLLNFKTYLKPLEVFKIEKNKIIARLSVGKMLLKIAEEIPMDQFICMCLEGEKMYSDHLSSLIRAFEEDSTTICAKSDILIQSYSLKREEQRKYIKFINYSNKNYLDEHDTCFASTLFRKSLLHTPNLSLYLNYIDDFVVLYLSILEINNIKHIKRCSLLKKANSRLSYPLFTLEDQLNLILNECKEKGAFIFNIYAPDLFLKLSPSDRLKFVKNLMEVVPLPKFFIKFLRFCFRLLKFIKA